MRLSLSEGGNKLFSSLFWKDVLERLVATLAQVAVGLLSADGAASVPAEVWLITLGVSGLGVIGKALAAQGVHGTVSPASFAPASPDRPAADKDDTDAGIFPVGDAVGIIHE